MIVSCTRCKPKNWTHTSVIPEHILSSKACWVGPEVLQIWTLQALRVSLDRASLVPQEPWLVDAWERQPGWQSLYKQASTVCAVSYINCVTVSTPAMNMFPDSIIACSSVSFPSFNHCSKSPGFSLSWPAANLFLSLTTSFFEILRMTYNNIS